MSHFKVIVILLVISVLTITSAAAPSASDHIIVSDGVDPDDDYRSARDKLTAASIFASN